MIVAIIWMALRAVDVLSNLFERGALRTHARASSTDATRDADAELRTRGIRTRIQVLRRVVGVSLLADPSHIFDLRAWLRERLVAWLQAVDGGAHLPRMRVEMGREGEPGTRLLDGEARCYWTFNGAWALGR